MFIKLIITLKTRSIRDMEKAEALCSVCGNAENSMVAGHIKKSCHIIQQFHFGYTYLKERKQSLVTPM